MNGVGIFVSTWDYAYITITIELSPQQLHPISKLIKSPFSAKTCLLYKNQHAIIYNHCRRYLLGRTDPRFVDFPPQRLNNLQSIEGVRLSLRPSRDHSPVRLLREVCRRRGELKATLGDAEDLHDVLEEGVLKAPTREVLQAREVLQKRPYPVPVRKETLFV